MIDEIIDIKYDLNTLNYNMIDLKYKLDLIILMLKHEGKQCELHHGVEIVYGE